MSAIGVCGAGIMGCSAAEVLLQAGRPVIAFDVAQDAGDKIESMGAETVASLAELAQKADLVLMFLPGPAQVKACVTGKEGLLAGLAPGAIIVDMSTVDPETSEELARAAECTQVGYLDAPVLGRPLSVGKWALPVGGDADILERARPVLDLLAGSIYHIGPSGSGNRIKLLNQLMFGAINAMTAEMMAIAYKVGIPPRLLYETITSSRAGTVSNLFKELGSRVSEEDYGEATFTVDLLIKDVHLAVEMASRHQAPPLLARTIEFMNETARAQGYGSDDTAVMWKSLLRFWDGK